MQRLEVRCVVRRIYKSLGAKRLICFCNLQCSAVQTTVQEFLVYFITALYDIYTLIEKGSFKSVDFNGIAQLSLQATV
jgi:hypothetical protein